MGAVTSSNRRDIIQKASTICCVVPLIVTIRSGHDASEMFIRAPLYTPDVNFIKHLLNIQTYLNTENYPSSTNAETLLDLYFDGC